MEIKLVLGTMTREIDKNLLLVQVPSLVLADSTLSISQVQGSGTDQPLSFPMSPWEFGKINP
jgi:hypothetical protein